MEKMKLQVYYGGSEFHELANQVQTLLMDWAARGSANGLGIGRAIFTSGSNKQNLKVTLELSYEPTASSGL